MRTRLFILVGLLLLIATVAGATNLMRGNTGGNDFEIQGALLPYIAQSVSVSGTTARNSTAFTQLIVRIVSTTNCFIKFGDSSVTATTSDHYLPAGLCEYFTVKGNTNIAVIQASASGTLYISEMN